MHSLNEFKEESFDNHMISKKIRLLFYEFDNHINENQDPVAGFLSQMETIKKDKNAFEKAVEEFSKASEEKKEQILEFGDEVLPEQKESFEQMISEFKSGNLTPDMLKIPMNTKQAINHITNLIDLVDFSIDFVKKYVK